ncbi:MAG: type II toxin-antitoxin system VapC family toxin [Anaerolineales bacterium]
MTHVLLLDTSVVIKWFRREEILADCALDLLHGYLVGQLQVFAPSLLVYEIANVLRYKNDLTTAQIETALQDLLDLGFEWIAPTAVVIRRAVVIARDYDTSVYDATFAATAETLGADFVTADERLVRRLAGLPYVRFLGDVGPSAPTGNQTSPSSQERPSP